MFALPAIPPSSGLAGAMAAGGCPFASVASDPVPTAGPGVGIVIDASIDPRSWESISRRRGSRGSRPVGPVGGAPARNDALQRLGAVAQGLDHSLNEMPRIAVLTSPAGSKSHQSSQVMTQTG